jgi:hypothetical protein
MIRISQYAALTSCDGGWFLHVRYPTRMYRLLLLSGESYQKELLY